MTWLWVLLVIGLMLYPLKALMPNARQYHCMQLRQKAIRSGLQVQLCPPSELAAFSPPLPSRLNMQYILPIADVPKRLWQVGYQRGEQPLGDSEWQVSGQPPQSEAWQAVVIDWLQPWDTQRQGEVALVQRGLALVIYWDERGSEADVLRLVDGLRAVAAEL